MVSKFKLFALLKDKLLSRVNWWTGRWLSKGGKEVLIKSILLDLPTYILSTFLIPLEICESLASVIAKFWWSSNPPKREIHWVKWEKLWSPREEGGIGFRMIHKFNLALLAKQLWRLVQFIDSLVERVLKGTYYRLSSPLQSCTVYSPSYVWTSISVGRKLLPGIRNKIHPYMRSAYGRICGSPPSRLDRHVPLRMSYIPGWELVTSLTRTQGSGMPYYWRNM